jgi:hypothetical protein
VKRDKAKTLAANFQDPRSYIAPDDREILYGTDWTGRKNQLWQRANGRCEQMIPSNGDFVRCRSEGRDPDHIIKRRVKGSNTRDDRLFKLQLLCALHHDLKHPEKRPQWTKQCK